MEYKLTCSCGLDVWVCEADAGSSTACRCGNLVRVPDLSELPAPLGTDARPDLPSSVADTPGPQRCAEIMAPVRVVLQTQRDASTHRPTSVMAALTAEGIWLQDTWQLRAIPWPGLAVELRRRGKELVLTLGAQPSSERLTLTFGSAVLGERWFGAIQERQQETPDAVPGDRHPPEGVTLLQQVPKLPYEVIGPVEYTGQGQWEADRGIQLRAGLTGADAVVGVRRLPCRDMGGSARQASGTAVRVADADLRTRLRLRWYSEEVVGLTNRMLLLLVVYLGLFLLSAAIQANNLRLEAPTDETVSEVLVSTGIWLGLFYAWPLAIVILQRLLRWPQLLRTAGLALLVATTLRDLAVWLAHYLAYRTTGIELSESKLWVWLDPFQWALMICGVSLCVRAWRLARMAGAILPPEMATAPAARTQWVHVLLATTGIYAVVFLGWAGVARFQTSVYVLQPGVDTQRERQALVAAREAEEQANHGDLAAAERSWQRALRLWEELTAKPSAPSGYRVQLAMTLHNLGWLRLQQGRKEEAANYYARAAALAEKLVDDAQLDEETRQFLARPKAALAGLRAETPSQQLQEKNRQLDEKDRTAGRKYEEAQVLAQKGEVEAESRYREAIALWEEILPQATNAEYRKGAVVQLAEAYLLLAGVQQRQGKRSEAETSLKRGIDYGEKAVALDPDRPLPKHQLEVARNRLDVLRELALQEEIGKLCAAQRYADAIDSYSRGIEEQEEQVRTSKDRNAAIRRLAYRLDRFAWFLAHCPDDRVRDTKAAVKRARRATELQPDVADYWYTFALVHYRNSDWQESLAALEKVKARESEFDAYGWLLVAMNRQQLRHREEARDALRRAADWMTEQQRKAESNAELRYQYEMLRPGIEALRREAERLIEGKEDAAKGVG